MIVGLRLLFTTSMDNEPKMAVMIDVENQNKTNNNVDFISQLRRSFC